MVLSWYYYYFEYYLHFVEYYVLKKVLYDCVEVLLVKWWNKRLETFWLIQNFRSSTWKRHFSQFLFSIKFVFATRKSKQMNNISMFYILNACSRSSCIIDSGRRNNYFSCILVRSRRRSSCDNGCYLFTIFFHTGSVLTVCLNRSCRICFR